MRYRHAMNLFYIALPICVLLRTIQLIFTIDQTTGFIKQQYSEISVVIMFVIFAAVFAVGLISFLADGIKADKEKLKPILAIASVLTGGMFIYDTVTGLSNLSVGAWHDVVLLVFGILSAIVFVAYGLKNVYYYDIPGMMLVIPTLYYVIKLINIFVSTSSLALVTENIFLIFTNGALLLFMFEFSKFENDMDGNEKRPKKLLGIGVATVLLCAVSSIPKIIMLIANRTEPSQRDLSSLLLSVAVGAFVFVFIICNFLDKESMQKNQIGKHLAQQ